MNVLTERELMNITMGLASVLETGNSTSNFNYIEFKDGKAYSTDGKIALQADFPGGANETFAIKIDRATYDFLKKYYKSGRLVLAFEEDLAIFRKDNLTAECDYVDDFTDLSTQFPADEQVSAQRHPGVFNKDLINKAMNAISVITGHTSVIWDPLGDTADSPALIIRGTVVAKVMPLKSLE